MALLKYIIYLLLIVFPILEIGKISFSNGVSLSINDALVGIIFVFFLTLLVFKKINLKGQLKSPIFLFFIAGFFSLVINLFNFNLSQIMVSSLYLLRWISYSFIYFSIIQSSKKTKKKISNLLFVSGLVVLFFGFIQYVFYQDLKNLFYLGWDEHLYRLFGGFFDPNFAGIFLSLFAVYVLGFLLKEKRFNVKIFYSFVILFSLLAIVLTYSRTALLTLAVCVLTFLFLSKKIKLFFVFFFSLVFFIAISPKAFQTEGTNLFRTASSYQRLESMNNAIEIFKKNPVLGVGFNTYRYSQNKYGYLTDIKWEISHSGAGVENSYLFILATTGILGALVYINLLRKIFISARKTKDDIGKNVLISSLFGLLASALFINSLLYPPLMLWTWFLVGVTESS